MLDELILKIIMKNNIDKLKVKFNNIVVGYLQEKDGQIGFQYDDEWLKTGFCISPFKLPLNKKIFFADKNKLNGLFGVFNDSLPDGWGILLIKRMLEKYGIDYEKLSPLTQLTLVGSNGLGGFDFEPCQLLDNKILNLDLDIISKKVQDILNDDYSQKTLDEICKLGGSSGGARPKAHIWINNEEWIIKFKNSLDEPTIGIDEYTANLLAKKSNINVNEFKLFKSKISKGYFGSKRFDRKNGRKIHMISLSGLLDVSHRDYNLDYLILFQIIKSISCKPKEDTIEAYKRMCFNVLYNNKDDHAKNWSFLYDENLHGYVLSPFYDITQTKHLSHRSMLVFDKEEPSEQDLLNDAKKIGIHLPEAKIIINQIKSVINKS